MRRHDSFWLIFPTLVVSCLVGLAVYIYITADATPANAIKPVEKTNASLMPGNNKPKRFGLYASGDSITKNEQRIGTKADIMAWFQHFDEPLNSNKLVNACKDGYMPQITWESWHGKDTRTSNPFTLERINRGEFDMMIEHELAATRKACGNNKLIIRFDHEMDTRPGKADWYPWQGNPEAYKTAWKRIVTIGRKANPQILWLWSPNRGAQYTQLYYPGDEWVDYVGLTLNNPQRGDKNRPSFAYFYGQNQAVIESFNKPIIIGETTVNEAEAEYKSRWIKGMMSYIASNPRITAFVWLDIPKTKDEGDIHYDIASSPESLQAFKESLPVALRRN